MKKILIKVAQIALTAQLNDSHTAQEIWKALPIEGTVNTWGDEIYFAIPVKLKAEADARAEVQVGELGYWPTGHAFCIFFGPTPASTGETPRAASPVNVFGRVIGDTQVLRNVPNGARITIQAAE